MPTVGQALLWVPKVWLWTDKTSSHFGAYMPLDGVDKCIKNIKSLSLLKIWITWGQKAKGKVDWHFLDICNFIMCCVGGFMSCYHHNNPVKDEYEYLYFWQFGNVICLTQDHARCDHILLEPCIWCMATTLSWKNLQQTLTFLPVLKINIKKCHFIGLIWNLVIKSKFHVF